MSVGKYSPTVSLSYSLDQNWWKRNGGGYGNGNDPTSDNDNDGYDSYGYSEDGSGPDRAGYTEDAYLTTTESWTDHEGEHHCDYTLYDRVYSEWESRRLGDLNAYLRFEEIDALHGLKTGTLRRYQEFFLLKERVRFTSGYYMIHKDDVGRILTYLPKSVISGE